MPPMLLVKNGRVLDPSRGTDAMLDVLLEGDRIAQVAPAISAPSAEVFDATGMVVAPGFIDLHCHLREDRKSTRLNSSHGYISYAVFCLKKKKKKQQEHNYQVHTR